MWMSLNFRRVSTYMNRAFRRSDHIKERINSQTPSLQGKHAHTPSHTPWGAQPTKIMVGLMTILTFTTHVTVPSHNLLCNAR